jgi:hypothetical protein
VPRPATLLARAAVITSVVAALVVLGACADDGGGDTERFCGLVQENVEALRAEPQTPEEIESLIDLWTEIGEDAPLAIEPDWQAHVLNFETAWTGTDEEEIYARVYATERSSVAVVDWLRTNCGIDFGPVTTIVPQTTTTIAPPPTTAPPGG